MGFALNFLIEIYVKVNIAKDNVVFYCSFFTVLAMRSMREVNRQALVPYS